jgi:hypothetical protein
MVNAPSWCVVGAAVMLLVGPAAGRTPAGSDPKALLDRAVREGTVRVLVQLQVAAEPEGALTSAEAVADQRAIAVAQSALMAELVGARYRLIRTYETIPFLALEVSSDALRILEASSLVVGIEEDRLELPLSTPSMPTGLEPCSPVAPDTPPQQK